MSCQMTISVLLSGFLSRKYWSLRFLGLLRFKLRLGIPVIRYCTLLFSCGEYFKALAILLAPMMYIKGGIVPQGWILLYQSLPLQIFKGGLLKMFLFVSPFRPLQDNKTSNSYLIGESKKWVLSSSSKVLKIHDLKR